VLRAEPVFQSLDVIGDHGRRHVQALGGERKTACFRDFGEDREAGELIHHYPVYQDNYSTITNIINFSGTA
jgi:hypothetical protein